MADILTLSFDDTDFETTFDPDNPTKQTERLSYILANALNGLDVTVVSRDTTEHEDEEELRTRIVQGLLNGFCDDPENPEEPTTVPIQTFMSYLESTLQAVPNIPNFIYQLQILLSQIAANYDNEGNFTGSKIDDQVEALYTIAANAGISLEQEGYESTVYHMEIPEEL